MSTNNKFYFKFYDWEEKFKDKPFLRQPFGDSWEEYTWGETGQLARRLATGLKSLGLKKGSHIGLISKNCREWIIADLAIIMAGYVSVPFFPNLKSTEIKSLIEFGEVSALFVGKLENWEEMKNGVDKDLPIIAFPHYENNSIVSEGFQWDEFISKFEPQRENYHPNLDDIWTIIFTSGIEARFSILFRDFPILTLSYGLAQETENWVHTFKDVFELKEKNISLPEPYFRLVLINPF